MTPPDAAAIWVSYAEEDVQAMQTLLAADPVTSGIVCFLAQQAVEKYLKALLVAQATEPPRIHDLTVLLRLCQQKDPSLAVLQTECAKLEMYAVASRYPMLSAHTTAADAADAAGAARKVCSQIRNRLGK